jgi:hypothetical protein
VELPLATDENGLRKETLEKIGSEELARLEQLKRKGVLTGEGGNLSGAKREASKQLIQVVDQGTRLADGLSRGENSGQVRYFTLPIYSFSCIRFHESGERRTSSDGEVRHHNRF